jgi:hypothetical protein
MTFAFTLPAPAAPGYFWKQSPASLERALDSSLHARPNPFGQFWSVGVLAPTTTRKPTLLLMLRASLLLRFAARQFLELLFQEPPRSRSGASPFCRLTRQHKDCKS